MIERGTEYLNALPADRVLAMRFESIIASPEEEMSRFINFLGADFAHARWLQEVSALPRRRPPSWTRLSPERHARLVAACAPGRRFWGTTTGPGG